MTELRQYLLMVICACLLCSILPVLSEKEGKQIIRLICGVFLTVTVVAPVVKMDIRSLMEDRMPLQNKEEITAQGQEQARTAMGAIIKAETEAYILDKARELGLSLSVTVQLGSDEIPIPVGVILQGAVTTQKKEQLAQILTEDLGIPKEAQQWISG